MKSMVKSVWTKQRFLAKAEYFLTEFMLGKNQVPMLQNNTAENYHGNFNPIFSRVKILQ
jgi:hypothetical protein